MGYHFHPELTENARELELVRQVGSIFALIKMLELTCLPLTIHGFLDFMKFGQQSDRVFAMALIKVQFP